MAPAHALKIELNPEEVHHLASMGYSKTYIAQRLAVSRETFYKRLEDSPDILDKYNEGKELYKAEEEDKLIKIKDIAYDQAMKEKDPSQIRFLLTRRLPKQFGNTTKLEHSGDLTLSIDESGDGVDP